MVSNVNYSELWESEEVKDVLQKINSSTKNRLLWRFFYGQFKKEGSFIRLFGQLMYLGGMYDTYSIAKNMVD